MVEDFSNLERACGGSISLEAIEKITLAIELAPDAIDERVLREYRGFMRGMKAMFLGPVTMAGAR